MGGKRFGKRKFLYFCTAGLIFLLLTGCTSVEKRTERIGIDIVTAKPREEPAPASKLPAEKIEKIEKKEKAEVREPPPRAQKPLIQGDYEGFLKENEKVLSLPGSKVPKDEALFNLGLVYAHPGNPKKDYGRSIGFFNRLLKEYPQSPLSEQVRIWVGGTPGE